MRDLVVLTIILAALPVAVFWPWIGVLLWSWIGYMNPHRLAWTFAYDLPFAKLVAAATLVGLLFSRQAKPLPRTRSTTLLLVFWMWMTLTTVVAEYPELAWPKWQQVSKIFLMTFVTMLLFQEVEKIRYLVLTIALSIAVFGVKSGLAGLFAGFGSMIYAYPPDSFIADNNDMALALNMVIPLLVLLGWAERRPLLKSGFYAISAFAALGVLSTFSRGGFLGFSTVILMLVARSRRKALNLMLVALGVLLVAPFASINWYSRISSIAEYQEDSSAQGRLEAWTVATRLALESPITGRGFKTLQPEMYQRYGFERVDQERAAHSIFFQVLSEHGFVGLGIFVALLGSTLTGLQRVTRMTAPTSGRSQLSGLARAIQTSLIAFVVSGSFLSQAYFDLAYHLIAIAILLTNLADQGIVTLAESMEEEGAAGRRPVVVQAE